MISRKNIDVLSFDRKSGKFRQIREIENDNFHFTEKIVVLSFDRKYEKNWQNFLKLKMTSFISRIFFFFLGHCFMSMEIDLVRSHVQKLVSLSMWQCLLESRRDAEFKITPKWKKFWKAILKKDAKMDEETKIETQKERFFLKNLIEKFVQVLNTIAEKEAPEETVTYCEHFLLLMIDLEALLPTRRFFNTVMDDTKLVIHCSLSALSKREEGKLFSQLLDQLKFYARFEISDETGDPLNDKEMMQIHYDRITGLQRAMFAKYPDNYDMRRFALATVASIDARENLEKYFKDLKKEILYDIAEYLFLVPPKSELKEGELGNYT